ncbi:hypothetical protein ACJZ2D_016471 [Fusarium nematophilum]
MVFSFATDIGKAKKAARTFHTMLREERTIDGSKGGNTLPQGYQGKVEFQAPGEHIALVGSSGCGKSTCFALLERLYDPDAGSLKVDGQDIKDLHVGEYRKALAYVSQEPTMYSGTIRDNILLGCHERPDEEAILQACKGANIHDFISSLPEGLSTMGGVMLSGGQKQRIAIARTLLRNPRVLLLGEATFALDSESEKLVQEALGKAAQGRTTISVAHRLSFVRNADKIYVIEKGGIVESGTHGE